MLIMLIMKAGETNGPKSLFLILPTGPIRPLQAVAGFEIVTVASNQDGYVDTAALRQVVQVPDSAALMLTNPTAWVSLKKTF